MPKIDQKGPGGADIIIQTSYPVKKVIWGRSINGKSMAIFQRRFAHSPIQTLRLTKHHQILGYVDKTAQGEFRWFHSFSELQKARAQQHGSFAVVEKGKEPRCYLGGSTAKPISYSEFLKAHSEGTPSTARYSYWNAFFDILQLSALILGGAGMHRFRGAPATALLAFPAVSHQTVTIGPEMQVYGGSASMPTISSSNTSLFIAWDRDTYDQYQTYFTDKDFIQVYGPNTAYYAGSQITRNPAASVKLQNSYVFAYQECCASSCLCARADLELYQFGVEGGPIASGNYFFPSNPPNDLRLGAVSDTLGVMWRDPSTLIKSFSTTFDLSTSTVQNVTWQQPDNATYLGDFDLAGGDHFSTCFSQSNGASPNMTLYALNLSTNRTHSLFNWLYTDYNSTQFPRCSICTSNNTDVVAWAYKDGISVFNIQNDQLLPVWNVLYTKNITFSALSVVCAPRWMGLSWSQNNATSLTSSYFAAGDINTNLPLIPPTALHFDNSSNQGEIDMTLISDYSIAAVYTRAGTGIFGTKLTVNNDSWPTTSSPTSTSKAPTTTPTVSTTLPPSNAPSSTTPSAIPHTSSSSNSTGVIVGAVIAFFAFIAGIIGVICGVKRFRNKSSKAPAAIPLQKITSSSSVLIAPPEAQKPVSHYEKWNGDSRQSQYAIPNLNQSTTLHPYENVPTTQTSTYENPNLGQQTSTYENPNLGQTTPHSYENVPTTQTSTYENPNLVRSTSHFYENTPGNPESQKK